MKNMFTNAAFSARRSAAAHRLARLHGFADITTHLNEPVAVTLRIFHCCTGIKDVRMDAPNDLTLARRMILLYCSLAPDFRAILLRAMDTVVVDPTCLYCTGAHLSPESRDALRRLRDVLCMKADV